MRSSILSICVFAVIFVCVALAGDVNPVANNGASHQFAKIDKQWDVKKDAKVFKRIRKDAFGLKDTREKPLWHDKKVKALLHDRLEELNDKTTFDKSWNEWANTRREVKLNSLEKLREAMNPAKAPQGCANCQFSSDTAMKSYDALVTNVAEDTEDKYLSKGTLGSLYKRIIETTRPDYIAKLNAEKPVIA